MTITELSDFVCTKVNQTAPEDIAACKSFIRRRHTMLWDDQLWKDAVTVLTITIDPAADTYAGKLAADGIVLFHPHIARVLALRAAAWPVAVLDYSAVFSEGIDAFAESGNVTNFTHLPSVVWQRPSAGETGYETSNLWLASADGSQENELRVQWVDRNGRQYDTTINTNGSLLEDSAIGGSLTAEVLSIGKGATNAAIELTYEGSSYGFNADRPRAAAADTVFPVLPRIRLLRIPSQSAVYRVLVKTAAPSLSGDNDPTRITGVDNTLIAFVQSDMLERGRQYQKAMLLKQEGALLLEQLKGQEVVQQANSRRIIPWDGFGNPYDWWSQFPAKY
jgi:hypothetical protein